jgi:hypothetical protein
MIYRLYEDLRASCLIVHEKEHQNQDGDGKKTTNENSQ